MKIVRNILWDIIVFIDNVYAEKYIYPQGSLIKYHRSFYRYYEEMEIYNNKIIYRIKMKYHYSIMWILNRIYCIRGDCLWLMGFRRNRRNKR